MHCNIMNCTCEKLCGERIKPMFSSHQSVQTLSILSIIVPVPVNSLLDIHTKNCRPTGKSFTYYELL